VAQSAGRRARQGGSAARLGSATFEGDRLGFWRLRPGRCGAIGRTTTTTTNSGTARQTRGLTRRRTRRALTRSFAPAGERQSVRRQSSERSAPDLSARPDCDFAGRTLVASGNMFRRPPSSGVLRAALDGGHAGTRSRSGLPPHSRGGGRSEVSASAGIAGAGGRCVRSVRHDRAMPCSVPTAIWHRAAAPDAAPLPRGALSIAVVHRAVLWRIICQTLARTPCRRRGRCARALARQRYRMKGSPALLMGSTLCRRFRVRAPSGSTLEAGYTACRRQRWAPS
jgi:hypothetical protein